VKSDETDNSPLESGFSSSDMRDNLALSSDGRTVSRRHYYEGNDWGNIYWNKALEHCKVKITFKIDKVSGEGIVIGIIPSTGSRNVYSCLNSNSFSTLWSWTYRGRMHFPGHRQEYMANWQYTSGDEVSLVIDLFARTMTCLKGGELIHKFENIAESVLPCVSIEGYNNAVTIVSVSGLGKGALSGNSMTI